ncbi:MAG: hypothetical protein IPJ77_07980 [Planctomycetes bacterium]|nr:hypothetical protein [Planctomycetota bacterium]
MKRPALTALAGLALLATGVGLWRAFAGPEPEPAPTRVAAPRYEPDPNEPPRRREALGSLPKQAPKSAAGLVDAQWVETNRQGIQALEAGDTQKAAELFDACRVANPSEKVFAENQAEALARGASRALETGDPAARSKAIEALKRALELAPARNDIEARLRQAEKLAQSEQGLWTDTSEHFELAYDGERQDLLWSSYQITSELEAAYQDLGERFGRWPVENGRPRIRVVLYRRAGFLDATGIGHWAGGLYDGTIRVPVEELGREKRELARVLRHETVHAFVAEAGGRGVPGWLNEGLAQWLEQKDLGDQQRAIQAARAGLRGKTLLSLAELKKSLASLKDEETMHRAYQQSLAFVDHLERTYGERVLYEMVAGCTSGVACEATFRSRTAVELDVALADLARGLD